MRRIMLLTIAVSLCLGMMLSFALRRYSQRSVVVVENVTKTVQAPGNWPTSLPAWDTDMTETETATRILRSVFGQVKSPSVYCLTPKDWRTADFPPGAVGVTNADRQEILLAGGLCGNMDLLPLRPPLISLNQAAWSVNALTHETAHLAGFGNEAQAECYSAQSLYKAARILRANKAYATRLAVRFWGKLYDSQSSTYRSPECRPGGPWDLHLSDPSQIPIDR